jgi:hypothetical protein
LNISYLPSLLTQPPSIVEPRHYPQYFGILYSAVLGIIVNIFLGFGYWYGNVPELVMLGVSGCILWPAAVYYAHRARYETPTVSNLSCGVVSLMQPSTPSKMIREFAM